MITIYTTNIPDYTRDYHVLFKELCLRFQSIYGNEVRIVYPTKEPTWDDTIFTTVDEVPINFHDCEILVNFRGVYKGISFMDIASTAMCNFFTLPERSSEDCILALHHRHYHSLFHGQVLADMKSKLHLGITTPQSPFLNLDHIRNLRRITPKIDKLLFKGTYPKNEWETHRYSIKFLLDSEYYDGPDIVSLNKYLGESLTAYKIGLAIPGVAELCHRETEYMAVGMPFIKFEFESNLTPELIPNYHYISIPRIDTNAVKEERIGGEKYAELYIKKFLEVKDDIDFLEYISRNAMNYYDTYLHPRTRIGHIFNLWNMPQHRE